MVEAKVCFKFKLRGTSYSAVPLPPMSRLLVRFISRTSALRADPWPLPHTAEHLQSTKTPTDIPPPTPIPRPNESLTTLRSRLVYQSRKRGTLESDLILSTFARDHLMSFSEPELREYDKVRSPFLHFLSLCFILHRTYVAARRSGLGHLLLGNGRTDSAGALGDVPHPGKTQNPRAKRGKSRAPHAHAVAQSTVSLPMNVPQRELHHAFQSKLYYELYS